MMRPGTAALLLLLNPSPNALGLIQVPVVPVTGEPSCSSCAIRVARRVTLGSPSDSVGVAGPSHVAAGTHGEFYVVSPFMPTAGALEYDSTGALIGTLGRAGGGPGELSQAVKVATTDNGDVLLQDRGGGIHVFAPDGRFRSVVRGIPPSPIDIAAIGDSLVAVPEARQLSPGTWRHAVRLHDLDSGTLVATLGEGTSTAPGVTDVAVASTSQLWLVDSPLELSLWGLDGRQRKTLRWDRRWIRHLGGAFADPESAEPLTRARSVWQDPGTGLLWVMTVLQDPSAPDPFAPVKPGSPLPRDYFGPARLAASLRPIISILDPATGRVVANDLVELENGVAQSFLRDGRLTALAEDADGNMWIEVLTLQLDR